MIGVLIIGFIVYKKVVLTNPVGRNSMLKILEILRLPDRKILYIIKCKDEQFLIASSNENVTLISKLEKGANLKQKEDIEKYLQEKTFENTGFEESFYEEHPKKQVMKSLLKELSNKNQTKRGNY